MASSAPLETLVHQVEHQEPDHFIYKQITERKKPAAIVLPDLRKPFLWLVATISMICVTLAVVAALNPVPVFSSSKGLLAVTAFYPNSTTNTANDGFNEDTSTIPRQTVSKRGHAHYDEDEGHEWDDECACYTSSSKPTSTARPKTRTRYSTTVYSTTTAVGLVTITPRPTAWPASPDGETEAQNLEIDPGAFAALYLGVSGACLQRRSGVLVCTSSTFSPNYLEIYELAGLAANVTAQLPSGTGGGSLGILISIIAYAFTAIAFIVAALPRTWFFGPRGSKAIGASGALPDLRHQWIMIFATGLAAISTFAIVGSAVQLQNTFGASASAVEAWDVTKTLKAKLLNSYGYLYACAVLSGLCLVSALALVAYDFNRPWWMPRVKEESANRARENRTAFRTVPFPVAPPRSQASASGRTIIVDDELMSRRA
ncbi:hypothetical protein P389DRAFT_47334 [Cystobasidium minutum MCA 4210]|uniref:uncharacterized protein n=1 Tax=Cystobasidium minutum MCA 4210 TaxID=1397322 RepID=UPI0034CDA2C8|eukprot:jgi/Rhomi1/47334/CE47333_201